MCKEDLALNNQQCLICHKTRLTKPNESFSYDYSPGEGK